MKTLTPFILLGMFFLGACEETVYKEVIKYVDRPGPTQFITETTEKECESTDTTSIEIVLKDNIKNGEFGKDTLMHIKATCYQLIKIRGYTLVPSIVKDSITFQDRIVYVDRLVYDTIREVVYDRTVSYLDTFVTVSYMRPTESIPEDILPHVMEFNQLAQQYGKQPTGGIMIIQYVSDLFGENWVSSSFEISDNSQQVIYLDQRLPAALHRNSIFREMARLQLNKKYSADVSKIMSPWFPYDKQATTKELNELFK